MKRYAAPLVFYLAAVLLWLFSVYCQFQSAALADLKTLVGDDVEGAIMWSKYGFAAFAASCFAVAVGSCLMPWFKRWERAAFVVSVTLGYGLTAFVVKLFLI